MERWKRAEHSRGLAKECSFLIINHEVKSVSHSDVADSATLRTVAGQAPLSMELSRQENWSGLTFPSPEDLPDPGIKPGSSASHKSHICLLLKKFGKIQRRLKKGKVTIIIVPS